MQNKKRQRPMKRIVLFFIAIGLVFVPHHAVGDNSARERVAVTAAERWLALVDGANYAESWREASELFRNAVTEEQWKQSLHGARKPLGKLVSRKVKTATYRTSLPGAPDGKYVVIQFETSFAKKKWALETVTPMLENDGNWRVSGYYIK